MWPCLFFFFPLFIFWCWGYLAFAYIVKVKVAQSCLTLGDPMDYRVHGILQARILEWVAFPFSRGSSQPRNWTGISCIAGGFFTNWAIREALAYISYTWIYTQLKFPLMYLCIYCADRKNKEISVWDLVQNSALSLSCWEALSEFSETSLLTRSNAFLQRNPND